MDLELLRTVGATAGLAGLAIGMILILFREIIRRNVIPTLSKRDGYSLLRMVAVLSWSIAIIGILAWAWSVSVQRRGPTDATIDNPLPEESRIVAGTVVDLSSNLAVKGAAVTVDTGSRPVLSDDAGNFQIILPSNHSDRVLLNVTKAGYIDLAQSVTPPTHQLILQMRRGS